jgi:hypothetical protein
MTPATRPTQAPADPWREVSAARLPAAYLAALAPVRDRSEVCVWLADRVAWVRWPAGRTDVVRCLLPVPGVAFFTPRDGAWFRFGSRLPTADAPPAGDGRSLAGVLVPGRLDPILPGADAGAPVPLRVVRGGEPKPVTALACRAAELLNWADTATTADLAAVRGAQAEGRVVLLGRRLPSVPGATRYWGDDLLVPVGFRPGPDLPPAAVRAAVGAESDELVLIDAAGAEVIPRAAFAPLTRAGLRLAVREGSAP